MSNINETIEKYKDAEIETYQFSCTLDTKTCKVCASLDGKEFKVRKAVVGKNCPPMHDGCRCFIRPVLNLKLSVERERAARNPLTGKSGRTKDQSYFEWQDSLTAEERDALIKKRKW